MNVKLLSPRCQRLPKRQSAARLRKSEPHEPPLDMFGADAVERWFTEKEVEDLVKFINHIST